MAKDTTQQNAVPEPRSIQEADAAGYGQRDEPVKLGGVTTEDPINSHAWELYSEGSK